MATEKKAAEGAAEGQAAVLEGITKSQKDAWSTVEQASGAMLEGVTKWNSELTEFITHRIEEDIKTQQDMINCKSPDEFRKLQLDFFSRAVQEYSNEASRLMKMGGEMMSHTMERK